MASGNNSYVPYEVDYSVKNVSKMVGFGKKKVAFKFGFANNRALEQGLEGSNCRGSEHEVVFIWSLSSGKRVIVLDGKDVHYSETGQNGWTSDRAFQHAFNLQSKNLGTFRLHLVTQPVSADVPGAQRPFDLRLNGMSFFSFSHIYQLGTPAMVVRYNGPGGGPGGPEGDYYTQRSRGGGGERGSGGYYEQRGGGGGGPGYSGGERGYSGSYNGSSRGGSGTDEPINPEERKALAQARLESMRDFREQQNKQQSGGSAPAAGGGGAMKRDEGSLISFDEDANNTPPIPRPQQFTPGHHISSITMGSEFNAPPPAGGGYQQYPPQQQPPQQPQPYQQYQQAPPPQQQLQQQYQPAPPPTSAGSMFDPMSTSASGSNMLGAPPSSSATALTPYQPPAGGAPPPPQQYGAPAQYQQQQPAPNAYGASSSYAPQQPPQQFAGATPYNSTASFRGY